MTQERTDEDVVRDLLERMKLWVESLNEPGTTATARYDEALVSLDGLVARNKELEYENDLNGEAIMLVRHHLDEVGIEAAFVDDVAALAAHKIRTAEERIETLYEAWGRTTAAYNVDDYEEFNELGAAFILSALAAPIPEEPEGAEAD